MNIVGFVILVFIALLLVGIVFKLAKFALKLASLVILFVFIIWIGFFIYDNSSEAPTDRLYVIEFNDSFRGYTLGGENYNFTDLEDEDTVETLSNFDNVYLVSYDTLKKSCIENSSILNCVKNASLDSFWKQVELE